MKYAPRNTTRAVVVAASVVVVGSEQALVRELPGAPMAPTQQTQVLVEQVVAAPGGIVVAALPPVVARWKDRPCG